MHEIVLAMKTDIIVATAGNKRGCYFTAYISFCDYIANSLKLHALPHANTPSELHLFTLLQLSHLLCKLYKFYKFYWIPNCLLHY